MERDVRTVEDVLELLDGLFAPDADRWTGDAAGWWDGFYADRNRPVPFFADEPDENLVEWLERGLIGGRRALDLGCGPGRNALYLAERGFAVDAVDLSPQAIAWARERAREMGLGETRAGETGSEGAGSEEAGVEGTGAGVRFLCQDAFGSAGSPLTGPYDLVYDSGCFHHLPPHRRISHLALLDRVLAPGGHLALTCFAAGAMGCELSDAELYRTSRLHGGLAYTPDSLRRIFADLTEVELRRMRDEPEDSPHFGETFLWAGLFRREAA
ncbi:class I SAM-dependent methyltransferase [Streptomyces sp. NPDC056188]|uniref:class I SAM-dependent methyltransferase n=1 Tax=Streptomyces sp. NPDC056188 TaxID=3345740 RepID=UPI0035D89253